MFGALRRTKPRARRESPSPSPSSSRSSSGDQIAMSEADAALWEADPQGYIDAQRAALRREAEEYEEKKKEKQVSWANLADGGYLAGEVDGVSTRDFAVFPEQQQQQQSEQGETEENVEEDENGDEDEESSSDEEEGLTMAVRKRT